MQSVLVVSDDPVIVGSLTRLLVADVLVLPVKTVRDARAMLALPQDLVALVVDGDLADASGPGLLHDLADAPPFPSLVIAQDLEPTLAQAAARASASLLLKPVPDLDVRRFVERAQHDASPARLAQIRAAVAEASGLTAHERTVLKLVSDTPIGQRRRVLGPARVNTVAQLAEKLRRIAVRVHAGSPQVP